MLSIQALNYAQSPCLLSDDTQILTFDPEYPADPDFDPPNEDLEEDVVFYDPPEYLDPIDGEPYYDLYDEGYQRDIFLVHGLAGNGGNWDNIGPYIENGNGMPGFNGWKTDVHTPDYSLNQVSLWSIGAELEEEIESFNLDIIPTDNIIIAHSMGGLASRVFDMNYSQNGNEKPFGAIITFGTPHLGAHAAESLANGEMDDFIVNACTSLTKGPIKEFEENNTFFDLLGDVGILSATELIQEACSLIGDFAFEQIKNRYTAPVAQDLVPDTYNINTLNNHSPNGKIKRVAFYGVEKDYDDLAWRFFHSALEGVNFPGMGLGQAGFNDDAPAIEQMEKVQTKYISKHEQWEEAYENFTVWPIFDCGFLVQRRKYEYDDDGDGEIDFDRCLNKEEVKNLRNAWRSGEDWTLSFNDVWKVAIGQTDVVETCVCILDDSDDDEPETVTFILVDGQACEHPDAISCQTNANVQEVDKTDGLVTVTSQTSFPGMAFPLQYMPGSNHLQMRNDQNTITGVSRIFSGEINDWFMTPERE